NVSIIPRGIGALGYTIQRPTEDRFLMTRQTLRDKMTVLMGGRAAESIVFDEISTGATDDLDKITDIAQQMVMRFGMDDEIGQVVYDKMKSNFLGNDFNLDSRKRNYSEATAQAIDVAVKSLVGGAFERAKKILTENRDELNRGAELLLQRETLNADDLIRLRDN
ncbi:MAG: cell division protease FtsH, partial [Gammaproteobacteria bacterium]